MELFNIPQDEKSSFTHTKSGRKLPYTAKQVNTVFLIQYYEDCKRLSKHRAIGFSTLINLLDDTQAAQVLTTVMQSNELRPEIKLKDGSMFRFCRRKPEGFN